MLQTRKKGCLLLKFSHFLVIFFPNQTPNIYSEDFKDLVPNLFLLLTQSNLNYVRGEPCTYEFSIEKKFTLGNSS